MSGELTITDLYGDTLEFCGQTEGHCYLIAANGGSSERWVDLDLSPAQGLMLAKAIMDWVGDFVGETRCDCTNETPCDTHGLELTR